MSGNEAARYLLIFVTLTVYSTELHIRVDMSCEENLFGLSDMSNITTCLARSILGYGMGWQCLQVIDHNETRDHLTCDFNINPRSSRFKLLSDLPWLHLDNVTNLENASWSCLLSSESYICDGQSQCLTDECHCQDNQVDIFYCADDSGCITWDRLCDGVQDCLDGSDECFCPGFIVFDADEIGTKICWSEHDYCAYSLTYVSNFTPEAGQCEQNGFTDKHVTTARNINPIEICLGEIYLEFYYLFYNSATRVAEYCQANCSHVENFDDGWIRFCSHITKGFHMDYEFVCEEEYVMNQRNNPRFHISQICDGKFDCENQYDERNCPLLDRFYCSPNQTAEWVHVDKVCDNIKDCINGTDECGVCQFEALSSSEFLIQSKIVLALASIMGLLIISLNLNEGFRCWAMTCRSKIKAIDRVFLLQIFFYDILMGGYLCFIVIAAVVLKLKGDYCEIEQQWRASMFCASLGVLFSFSSHGSLLAIASVSITRFLTCHSLLFEIKQRTAIISSILLTGLNLFHSILPLLPVSHIQDSFRTDLFLTNIVDNPFFDTNPVNISRLKYVYEGMLHRSSDTHVHTMINELSNLTSRSEIYEVLEIGYYGNTGLCVHNIFKDQDYQKSYKIYKILYCTVLLALLVIVSVAYIMIVCKQRKSSMATQPSGSQPTDHGSAASALTLKVALIIGSQLVCWIPFIMTVLYFQFVTSKTPSNMVFETFGLVVVPINSFLNPLFYGEKYKKVAEATRKKWRRLLTFVKSEPSQATREGAKEEGSRSLGDN